MPTFTETAKATKKKKDIKLVGIDTYIITDKGIPKFDDIGPFKCEFISNRGTKVWPGFVSPDLLQVTLVSMPVHGDQGCAGCNPG